jgi:hypothetical protein
VAVPVERRLVLGLLLEEVAQGVAGGGVPCSGPIVNFKNGTTLRNFFVLCYFRKNKKV